MLQETVGPHIQAGTKEVLLRVCGRSRCKIMGFWHKHMLCGRRVARASCCCCCLCCVMQPRAIHIISAAEHVGGCCCLCGQNVMRRGPETHYARCAHRDGPCLQQGCVPRPPPWCRFSPCVVHTTIALTGAAAVVLYVVVTRDPPAGDHWGYGIDLRGMA